MVAPKMAKPFPILILLVLFYSALTCSATMYMVGDNSGWEISTDLDTWAMDKRFAVGDVLVFQYPSSESVLEVTRENYDKCNTTDTIKTYSNGNTTVPLTKPGDYYFISGNRLYCLGGMKLHVTVDGDLAPAPAPQGAQAGLPRSSSKSDNPSNVFPNSSSPAYGPRDTVVIAFLGLLATVFFIGFA